MAKPRSDFLALLKARGQLHQCTDPEGLSALMTREIVPGYIGFDCTGPSLHIGHLIQIMTLRRLQQCGHKPIVVMGGGTTKVGDPSGRDETRQILTVEQIEKNKQSILTRFKHFLKFGDGPNDAVMVDNAEWLDKLELIPFLREVGRHFSVNRMLTMDSVKLRLERQQPLTFIEFNYMVMQAYDFVELYRRYGCRLQGGGSDQWGNIVSGIELGRRMSNAELFGVTSPLLATASGQKMGKTAAGAVWLNPEQLSPYDYWQYWRNTEDADVGRFLRIFTEMPEEEIVRLETLAGAELNEAKKILATQATAMCHGHEEAEKAAKTARTTFEEGETAEGLPTTDFPRDKLKAGVSVATVAAAAGLTATSSEARRFIQNQGLKVNDKLITDEKAKISLADVTQAGVIKLSAGRKKHVLVRPV